MLVAAMPFGMNFRGVGHELPRVLHVCVREERVVRRLFVRAVRVVLGGEGTVLRGRPQMRRSVCMVFGGLVNGHERLSLPPY